jgi:uncharacterized protein
MIVAIDESNQHLAREFLERHFDSALLLLGNLAEHGPRVGEHINSGNFQAVIENDAVVAAFCLTRRGNLLVQTGGREDFSQEILAACDAERLPIRGILGEFRGAHALWQLLCQRPEFRPGVTSKEVLYAVELVGVAERASAHPVRLAELDDFERWDALMQAFRTELGVPQQLTLEQRKAGFAEACARGHFWVGFAAGQIVAVATLFGVVGGSGQVGGIFTAPEYRRRGLSRGILNEVMRDCRARLGLERLVLFTAESNTPARALYESLGFRQVGEFGLFFARDR